MFKNLSFKLCAYSGNSFSLCLRYQINQLQQHNRSSLCYRRGNFPQFLTFKYADLKSNFLVILSLSIVTFVPCGLSCSHFVLPWTSACSSLYSRELQLQDCSSGRLGAQSCAEKVEDSPRGTARQEASVLIN